MLADFPSAEANIQPSPVCSDAQFLRRITLDLVGRIPTTQERNEFLARPDRAALIERLLKSPARSVDELFERFFGRQLTAEERETCSGRSLDEVSFALLHSSEFAFNH
jgi:hypothetical protein